MYWEESSRIDEVVPMERIWDRTKSMVADGLLGLGYV